MEEVIAKHPAVAECAVIGVHDDLKGEVPVGFYVLKDGITADPEQISKELIQMVRDEIGAIACFKVAICVKRLPKTRSGKILRGTMRKIANAEQYRMPSTIDDPAILSEIEEELKKVGYAQYKK